MGNLRVILCILSIVMLFSVIGCQSKIEKKKEIVMEKADKMLPEEEKQILNEAINEENVTEEDLDELASAMDEFQKAYEASQNQT